MGGLTTICIKYIYTYIFFLNIYNVFIMSLVVSMYAPAMTRWMSFSALRMPIAWRVPCSAVFSKIIDYWSWSLFSAILPILLLLVCWCTSQKKANNSMNPILSCPMLYRCFVAKFAKSRRGIRAPVLVQTFYEVQGAGPHIWDVNRLDGRKKTVGICDGFDRIPRDWCVLNRNDMVLLQLVLKWWINKSQKFTRSDLKTWIQLNSPGFCSYVSSYLDILFGSNDPKTSENPSMISWTVTHVWCNALPPSPSTVESPPGEQHEPHQRTQSGGFWRWSFSQFVSSQWPSRTSQHPCQQLWGCGRSRSCCSGQGEIIFDGILVWVWVRELHYSDIVVEA